MGSVEEAMENASCHLHLQGRPRCIWDKKAHNAEILIPAYNLTSDGCQHNALLFVLFGSYAYSNL